MQTSSPTPASAHACTARAAILLPAAPKYTRHRHFNTAGYNVVESSDAIGNEIALQTPYKPSGESEWPGVWYGNEVRVDNDGRMWSHFFRHNYVVDNFGDLVEVAR